MPYIGDHAKANLTKEEDAGAKSDRVLKSCFYYALNINYELILLSNNLLYCVDGEILLLLT